MQTEQTMKGGIYIWKGVKFGFKKERGNMF